MIDQFRGDFIPRYSHLFARGRLGQENFGGLRYFYEKGAFFPQAKTGNLSNITAVGHATAITGAHAGIHGIIGNDWFDTNLKKIVYCTEDLSTTPLASPDLPQPGEYDQRSPKNLLTTTLGDEMKNNDPGAKVISVSLKDRSAVLMGGHRSNLSLWFDAKKAENWVSSSYYFPEKKLPSSLTQLIDRVYPRQFQIPRIWNLLLPASRYSVSLTSHASSISSRYEMGERFPHSLNSKRSINASPWGNVFTLDMAFELLKEYHLGEDESSDLLAISLSSFDLAGHVFGPLSVEMQDMTLQLDRALGKFFNKLSKHFGKKFEDVLFVLGADHGVTINPYLAPKLSLPGELYTYDALKKKLQQKLGCDCIQEIVDGNLYFKKDKMEKKALAEIEAKTLDFLRNEKYILAAYSKQQIVEGRMLLGSLGKSFAEHFHYGRSGDVFFVPRAGFVHADEEPESFGANHEGPSIPDASIPIAFLGKGIQSKIIYQQITLKEIVPTVSALLRIIPPNAAEGQVVSDAFLINMKR